MQQVKLSIRLNGKKQISLYSNVKGTTPVTLDKLVNLSGTPDFIINGFGAIKGNRTSYYVGKDKDSKQNNKKLQRLLGNLEDVLKKHPELEKPKDIVDVYQGKDPKKKKQAVKTIKTLESFFNEVIDYVRYTEMSQGYRNYVTARNSIAKNFSELAKKPLADVSNGDVVTLQHTLRSKAPTAYIQTMKFLQATINRAIEMELNHNTFKWNWKKNNPKEEKTHQYIKPDKLNRIFNVDLDVVRGNVPLDKCTMFLDIVKLMYYTASRPVDTMQFNLNQVIEENGTKWWKYTPEKKTIKTTNGKKPKEACPPLKAEALAIIDKYKDNASTLNGYIFPILTNKHRYDKIQRAQLRNKILFDINKLLKRIGNLIGVQKLTVYDFRTTRLTELCKTNIPLFAIAEWGGTSIKMLDKHYANKSAISQQYANDFLNI